MIEFHKWTKIQSFHNVRKLAKKLQSDAFDRQEIFDPKMEYRAKVKLDGTNAAIRITKDGVSAQSRGKLITPEDDNYGFARWVDDNMSWVEQHSKDLSGDFDVTIYGEWAGKGIQKRTSISKIDRKVFCIFAIRNHHNNTIIIDPLILNALMEPHKDVYVIPWATQVLSIDYGDADESALAAEKINKLVIACEECDPFVKTTFAIEGLGEGYVFYPIADSLDAIQYDYEEYKDFMFKAKGDKHQTAVQTKPVIVDVELMSSANAFADKFVTEVRLEQALSEVGEASMKNTGAFLKWIGNDIKTEGADELEVSGLVWKNVAKKVSTKARDWWMEKCRE